MKSTLCIIICSQT